MAKTAEHLDVERLRRAIYAVSVRRNWAQVLDTEDRTEEIAAEYAADDFVEDDLPVCQCAHAHALCKPECHA